MSFQEQKSDLIERLKQLKQYVEDTNDGIESYKEQNILVKDFFDINSNNLNDILQSLEVNIKMLERTNMKCVTVGHTSNGKSAVLNALLKREILPSNMGKTTSCFIKIRGCNEDEEYRHKIDQISRYTNKNNSEKYDISSEYDLPLPRSQYCIFEEDIELWDSPGLDYSKDNDEKIIENCKDADVFLLVIDGKSVLNQSEKIFFTKLNKKGFSYDIIFLINKWDEIINDDEILKQRHRTEINECFVKDFKLFTPEYINQRTFFISAINVLSKTCKNENEEFEKFKTILMNDLTKNGFEKKQKNIFKQCSKTTKHISNILSSFRSKPTEVIRKCIKESIEKTSKDSLQLMMFHVSLLSDDIFLLFTSKSSGKSIKDSSSILRNKFKTSKISCNDFKNLTNDVVEIIDSKVNASLADLCEIFYEEISELQNKINETLNSYAFFDLKNGLKKEYLENNFFEKFKIQMKCYIEGKMAENIDSFVSTTNKKDIKSEIKKFVEEKSEVLEDETKMKEEINNFLKEMFEKFIMDILDQVKLLAKEFIIYSNKYFEDQREMITFNGHILEISRRSSLNDLISKLKNIKSNSTTQTNIEETTKNSC